MNKIAGCLVFLFFVSLCDLGYSNEWIPYQGQNIINHTQPVYVPIQPQPIVVYQWTPYIVQQNYVVQQQCWFKVKQTIVTVPTTQWVIQPVIIYR